MHQHQKFVAISILAITLLVTLFSASTYKKERRKPISSDFHFDNAFFKRHIVCGQVPEISESTEFGRLIENIVAMIENKSKQLCVIEVGTADGSGTTIKLFNALYKNCQRPNGKEFFVYTYEANPDLAGIATNRWKHYSRLKVIGEMVLNEDTLNKFVMPSIDGPEGQTYPGKTFYKNLYEGIPLMVASGKIGGFLSHLPSCTADLVLIDSTRYTHPGIVATLLYHNLTQPNTVFLVENDFWTSPDGDEKRLLELYWHLTDVSVTRPVGEMWPWLAFRITDPRQAVKWES